MLKTNNKQLEVVIIILIINLLVGLIYLISRIIKKDYKRGWIMTAFIILTPPIGAIYLLSSWIIFMVYFKNRLGILSIEELSLSKEKIKMIVKDDVRSAIDKVPLEEALIVSESKDARRLILDVLKEEKGDYINSIYQATDNKDSEVSHYAAAAITDIMDKFKTREKILREEDPREHINYLSEFLMTKILSSVEQGRYLKVLEQAVLKAEKDTPEILTGEHYYIIVNISIDLKRMEEAEFWVEKALVNKGDELESYKAGLSFYYTHGDLIKFKNLLEKLKTSDIRLNHETLEMIRFFS